jgi:hypothetical protein
VFGFAPEAGHSRPRRGHRPALSRCRNMSRATSPEILPPKSEQMREKPFVAGQSNFRGHPVRHFVHVRPLREVKSLFTGGGRTGIWKSMRFRRTQSVRVVAERSRPGVVRQLPYLLRSALTSLRMCAAPTGLDHFAIATQDSVLRTPSWATIGRP